MALDTTVLLLAILAVLTSIIVLVAGIAWVLWKIAREPATSRPNAKRENEPWDIPVRGRRER